MFKLCISWKKYFLKMCFNVRVWGSFSRVGSYLNFKIQDMKLNGTNFTHLFFKVGSYTAKWPPNSHIETHLKNKFFLQETYSSNIYVQNAKHFLWKKYCICAKKRCFNMFMMEKWCTKWVNIVKFTCRISLQIYQNTIFFQLYTLRIEKQSICYLIC